MLGVSEFAGESSLAHANPPVKNMRFFCQKTFVSKDESNMPTHTHRGGAGEDHLCTTRKGISLNLGARKKADLASYGPKGR